ncbi:MAG: heavy-metal-associated domain-containing protein [Verrucomicrobia bacterium]|jgi:copper ion binding protein|nr:heavy-metal-associated domain-containing protein [Verrucomicrobiota bacterium]
MRSLIKDLALVGSVAAVAAWVWAGDNGTCSADKAACPASAATCSASKDTCSASKDTCAAGASACCAEEGAKTAKAADKNENLVRVSYTVTGMTCAACETKVTKALAAIDGVTEASACADSKTAKLAYNPKKVKDQQVIAAINKAGFKVAAETLTVKVDGMSCGACSDKVSKKLASVKGVKEQKVCHESKQAVITFDPSKVSQKDVLAAIDSTGFKSVQ